MSNPLISVIVPVYNAGKYFDKCIESLRGQTYENLEIILVDDGSTDGTPAKCDKYASEDNRIKVVHKENCGPSSARNTGLDLATGSFIGFVDSDDWIDQDTIETALRAAKKSGADIIMFDCYYDFLEADTELRQTECFACEGEEILKNFLCDVIRPEVCNKLYKTELVGDFRFNVEHRYSEDVEFNFEMMKRSKSFYNIGQCKYHYLQNSGNSSTTAWITNARANSYRVTKAFIENLEESELQKYAVWRHVRFTYGIINRVVTSSDQHFFDAYFWELRNEILKYKSEIFGQNLYSAKHKIATIVLSVSPQLFVKHLRRKSRM